MSETLESSRIKFYDSLSKVWLTRRALKELDRRQVDSLQQPTSTPQPTSTSAQSISAPQPTSAYQSASTQSISTPQPTSTPQQSYHEETLNRIKKFATHGGPDLCDLRGYEANIDLTCSMVNCSCCQCKNTKKSSPYDECFEQHYIDHHVYPFYKYPYGPQPKPGGLDDFRQCLSQQRPSLSPSRFGDSDFEKFQWRNVQAEKEDEVMAFVIPMIDGTAGNADNNNDANIPNQKDQLLTGLNSMTGSVIVTPKPNFYDGARLQDLDKSIQEELGPFIVPTKHEWAPVVPNFFLEVKGLGGSPAVAILQALQNGALGARAMHSLQSYSKGKPVYDGNAYTITTTYQNGHLQIYTTHPIPGKDRISPEYHMTLVNAFALTSDLDAFRQGAAAFRNARDWAREQRDAFIRAANATIREPTRTEKMTYPEWLATLEAQALSKSTKTSADELAL